MLKLKPDATFKSKVSIPGPTGSVEIEVVFNRKSKDELAEFLRGVKDRSDKDTILGLVSGWDGVDLPFGPDSVELLTQNYLGAAAAIVDTYMASLVGARLGN